MSASKHFVTALTVVSLLILSSSCTAGEETVVYDVWSLIKVAGQESGWGNEKVVKIVEDGRVRYRSHLATAITMRRGSDGITITMEGTTLEDDKGKVIEMHQTMMLSGQATQHDLVVVGDKANLTTTIMKSPTESTITWDPEVIGPWGKWQTCKAHGTTPGSPFSYKLFSFDFFKVATVTTEFSGEEEVEMLDGEKATLHRAVATNDIMPTVKTHEWYGDEMAVAKTLTNIMGLSMESFLTTKERAKSAEGSGGEIKKDLILETMARSNINLPAPYRLESILYKFKAKDAEIGLPETLKHFTQEVLKDDGQEAVVRISTKVPESSQQRPLGNPDPELFEYMEANAYIQSDHEGLQKKAMELVGDDPDAWSAACKLERFVFEYIKEKNYGTGFASAAEVFENPRGDCTEHGVLLAALCRAAGIPSRVTMGYMYLGGIFGGHMWAEVWIDGNWYPLDGVMGIGHTDPTHITFSTSSLDQGGIGQAFVSAVQGLGNLEITILEFTRGGETFKIGDAFKDYEINGDTYTNKLYGITLDKPAGYEFGDYERDFSGINFTLVKMKGDSFVELKAVPAAFSFTLDEYRSRMKRDGTKVLSEVKRNICDLPSAVFMIEQRKKVRRILAVIAEDTCFSLIMTINDDERDIAAFEKMAKSIKL